MIQILQSLLLGVSIAAPIGPVNVEVIKRGLKHGFLLAFLVALGAACADATYVVIIYLGLSSFINIPIVQTVVWIFGMAVLIYLGYRSIKEFFRKKEFKFESKSRKNAFIAGYAVAISSPITAVWWLGVFGSIISSSIQTSREVALLSGFVIIAGILLWFLGLSLLLNWGKRFVNERTMRYMSGVAGVVLIGFGLWFGYNTVMSVI